MAPPQLSSLPTSITELSSSAIVPPNYISIDSTDATEIDHDLENEIPVIDFSLLVNGTPEQHSKMVTQLCMACQSWGFFKVVNHGISEELKDKMVHVSKEFFNMNEEENKEYASWNNVMVPIRYGTSFNSVVDDIRYWRDYLKVFVHPELHSPAKPLGFRATLQEYTNCTRALLMELLKGIWEGLKLDENHMNKALGLDSCYQVWVANFYPPCPQPELAMGLPAHSDHGLLTLVFQDGANGLEIKHGNKWVRVNPPPNSFLVNTGDFMEIVTNGRYKSLLHRAITNDHSTRVSIVTVVAPSLDTFVEPAEKPAKFRGMKYGEYVEFQQSNKLRGKSALDVLRVV